MAIYGGRHCSKRKKKVNLTLWCSRFNKRRHLVVRKQHSHSGYCIEKTQQQQKKHLSTPSTIYDS